MKKSSFTNNVNSLNICKWQWTYYIISSSKKLSRQTSNRSYNNVGVSSYQYTVIDFAFYN